MSAKGITLESIASIQDALLQYSDKLDGSASIYCRVTMGIQRGVRMMLMRFNERQGRRADVRKMVRGIIQ